MRPDLLGGLSASAFLRRHWQKKPLLVRNALAEFAGAFDRRQLFAFACRDDAQSRLVLHEGRRWRVQHGPFQRRALERLPGAGWALLVQGVNQLDARAQALLMEFAFLPYARLDDVMVSLAPPGGGVGPHVDSYDVFLLQTGGSRRWRVGRQRDQALIEGAPLKLLRDFRPTLEWRLEPGDMLYLPPGWAHEGVALSECVTCSIGFRAPAARELAPRFLEFLAERIAPRGAYTDPDLRTQPHPAQIGTAMLAKTRALLGGIRWHARDELEFLGEYLSEPKPHVVFQRPSRPPGLRAFRNRLAQRGARLDLKTQMLYRARTVFINGETWRARGALPRAFAELADRRVLPPGARLDAAASEALYQWYCAGYIALDAK